MRGTCFFPIIPKIIWKNNIYIRQVLNKLEPGRRTEKISKQHESFLLLVSYNLLPLVTNSNYVSWKITTLQKILSSSVQSCECLCVRRERSHWNYFNFPIWIFAIRGQMRENEFISVISFDLLDSASIYNIELMIKMI